MRTAHPDALPPRRARPSCAEGWITANPTQARLGRFASDAQPKHGKDYDDHACQRPDHPTHTLRESPAMRRSTETDSRIPFPCSPTPTACRATPQLFAHDIGDSDTARAEQAKAACQACPIATACLKWALANPQLTTEGIWAATPPRQRTALRHQLADRLGSDWAAVVADHDRRLRERREAARHTPLTVRQDRIVRMDRDLNGPMPRPRRSLTPIQQHRDVAPPPGRRRLVSWF
ncbi:WhiB family transcriptional regulator [Streptomyces avermitilis]|uniref:WhiB family transcriptional regulator n=1 Tax=Streptomyces avermitilis TaxID=33903 RepID=UPI001F5B661F|nr:WhiB family transcriptional regulator [Streptomyces avermitilis]